MTARLTWPLGLIIGLVAFHAKAEGPDLADAPDALPGLYRLRAPLLDAPHVAVASTFGYGWTEAQSGEAGSHHRVGGSAALGAVIANGFALNLGAAFRNDLHPDDGQGRDSGSVLDLDVGARTGFAVSPAVHLGLDVRFHAPGAEAFDQALGHPALGGLFLGAFELGENTLLLVQGGYRKDWTSGSEPEAYRLRRGDRVALGLSQFDAVPLGFGLSHRFGSLEPFAELSWDLLVGSGAPPATQSPLHASMGGRHYFASNLALGLVLDASVGARAPSMPSDPLVPIDPRFSALLTLNYRFGGAHPNAPIEKPIEKPVEVKKPAPPPPKTEPKEPPPPAAPTLHPLRVRVVDRHNHPISDAIVVAEVQSTSGGDTERISLTLRDRNVYESESIPGGDIQIVVNADLLKEYRQSVHVAEDGVTEVDVSLEPAATGSQLRGLVRSYTGHGVDASIRVEPLGLAVECDENGSFEVNLEPGSYDVVIEARGYRSQRRRLTVGKDGVTVLNADLEKAGN